MRLIALDDNRVIQSSRLARRLLGLLLGAQGGSAVRRVEDHLLPLFAAMENGIWLALVAPDHIELLQRH